MSKCESSGCFEPEEVDSHTIAITAPGLPTIKGSAVDTVEAWRVFRDQVKAGEWDHIGEAS